MSLTILTNRKSFVEQNQNNKSIHSFNTPIKRLSLISNRHQSRESYKQIQNSNHLQSSSNSYNPGRNTPTNALKKKCFQKVRQIKLIYELHPIYQSKYLTNTSYKYKADKSDNSSSRSVSQSRYLNSKSRIQKLPLNILALDSAISNQKSGQKSSKSSKKSELSKSFSISKEIKNSIIKY